MKNKEKKKSFISKYFLTSKSTLPLIIGTDSNIDIRNIDINSKDDWKNLDKFSHLNTISNVGNNDYFALRSFENKVNAISIDGFKNDNLDHIFKNVKKFDKPIIINIKVSEDEKLTNSREILEALSSLLIRCENYTTNLIINLIYEKIYDWLEIIYVIRKMYDYPLMLSGFDKTYLNYCELFLK